MAKIKSQFTCHLCGGSFPKWQGQCPACQAWNSLEETLEQGPNHRYQGIVQASAQQTLAHIDLEDFARISTLIPEFDRVLGGGLVDAGVVLIGGDPGIGKSTLLLQRVYWLELDTLICSIILAIVSTFNNQRNRLCESP